MKSGVLYVVFLGFAKWGGCFEKLRAEGPIHGVFSSTLCPVWSSPYLQSGAHTYAECNETVISPVQKKGQNAVEVATFRTAYRAVHYSKGFLIIFPMSPVKLL